MSYWVAGATLVGAVASSSAGASAAGDAASAQENAASQNSVAAATQANAARAENYPFLKTGTAANARLATLLGIGDSGGIKLPNGMSAYDQAKQEEDAFLHANGPAAQSYTSLEQYLGANPTAAEKDIQDRVKQILADNGIDPTSYQGDPEYGSLVKPFSSSDLAADPVYNSGLQFGLDQGTKAINARATATGNFDSGSTLKALTQFGNDYGSTKANDSFNRNLATKGSIYGMLSGQQGVGQQAAQSDINAGQVATGQNIDANSAAGNARAAGIVGGANAWGGIGTGVSTAYNNANNSGILKKLLGGQTGNLPGAVSGGQPAPYLYGGSYNPDN